MVTVTEYNICLHFVNVVTVNGCVKHAAIDIINRRDRQISKIVS